MRLTREHRIRIVELYYQNKKNGAKVARLFSIEFDIRTVHLIDINKKGFTYDTPCIFPIRVKKTKK